jgi:multimeric flavodoxin WrbA
VNLKRLKLKKHYFNSKHMKVLGINGSPRKGGNTDLLLDKVLEGAGSTVETTKIYLEELDIQPCREEEYYEVDAKGLSVVKDDMHSVFQKVDDCDVLILGSPIFFGSLSAQTKIMIDRFQCVWISKHIFHKHIFTKKKTGAFISVEASHRQDFFHNARLIVKNFFALINARYRGELFCTGLEEKEDVLKFQNYLDQAFKLGRDLCSQDSG